MFTPILKKFPRSRRCAVIVAAAGQSRRMEGGSKLTMDLDGLPVLVRTLRGLQAARQVDEILVAARRTELESISKLCRDYGITKCVQVVAGGKTRVESALRAAMETDAPLLGVHDGARPLASPELIDRVIAAASRCGAAAPAVPVKDTVKRVRKDGAVEETLDRAVLRAVQTPQVFDADLLKAALQSALETGFPATDDCSAVERLGKVVFLVEGEEENLKITTPLDLDLAEAILRRRKAGRT